nr:ATP-binding protein [Lachnospiraceae bacterium]
MNIKEAKKEIEYTIRSYLAKDEAGSYRIPTERQRPVLLIGPPGIGKTAIMRQIAEEMGIGLVSYTITHHTRQSAIGLPFISQKNYGGKTYSVTEYTMSEIVASVYDHIERTGRKEGILFLDEINCVSETLVPTMLQFLQMKTFGTHHLPEGFVLVCAGNPPEYNRQVRDFDIVTLDRVKRLWVEEDLPAFFEYAAGQRIHGAVVSYLTIHADHFYSVKNDTDGKRFVTARAWEDLAGALAAYEELDQPVTEAMVGAYLQDPEIAADFKVYYELWNRYRKVYRIPDVLSGAVSSNPELAAAAFDEKVSLLVLLAEAAAGELAACSAEKEIQKEIFGELKTLKAGLGEGGAGSVLSFLTERSRAREEELGKARELRLISPERERLARLVISGLKELLERLAREGTGAGRGDFALAREWFSEREERRKKGAVRARERLTNVFHFLALTFGEGQEMVLFLTQLSRSEDAMRFIAENGNEEFYH